MLTNSFIHYYEYAKKIRKILMNLYKEKKS